MCPKVSEKNSSYAGQCLSPSCRYAHCKSELRRANLPVQNTEVFDNDAWNREQVLDKIKYELQNEFHVSFTDIRIDPHSCMVTIHSIQVAQIAEDGAVHCTDFGLHMKEEMAKYMVGWFVGKQTRQIQNTQTHKSYHNNWKPV
jgi:hypothetical protein